MEEMVLLTFRAVKDGVSPSPGLLLWESPIHGLFSWTSSFFIFSAYPDSLLGKSQGPSGHLSSWPPVPVHL